jgi:lipooligosaccharide transport system ATP-binding protein
LRAYLASDYPGHDDLGHRLIIYSEAHDELFHRIADQYCKEGCLLRTSTLEDVFLRLTGRDLRE